MGHLKERMSADLLRYGLGRGTRKQYLRCVESYARHFRRSPDKLGSDDIEAWLDHLEKRQGKSEKIRQQALIALKFFYFATLNRPGVAACFPPIGTREPVYKLLSKSDVERLFSAIPSPLHQTVLTVAFGGGLRIGDPPGHPEQRLAPICCAAPGDARHPAPVVAYRQTARRPAFLAPAR
jgi:site-specific recombinase XerD